MIQNCTEQILNDVVRIELVPASLCDMAIPFNVSGISSMSGTKIVSGQTVSRIGAAVLTFAYTSQDGDEGEYESAPTLKQMPKRLSAGIVYTHDLQIVVSAGFQTTYEAVCALKSVDFHVVMTTQSGERYISYSLPNTSSVTMEEQGVDTNATVKVSLQSMSHVILLT